MSSPVEVSLDDLWFMILEAFRRSFPNTSGGAQRCAEIYRRYGHRLSRHHRRQLGTEAADAVGALTVMLVGYEASLHGEALKRTRDAWKTLSDEILLESF